MIVEYYIFRSLPDVPVETMIELVKKLDGKTPTRRIHFLHIDEPTVITDKQTIDRTSALEPDVKPEQDNVLLTYEV